MKDKIFSFAASASIALFLLLSFALSVNAQLEPERFKRIDYEYDLVSGKVNSVKYQENNPDQFYHAYEYDADNRLVSVKTSRDKIIWEKDAKYLYYAHGPLARTEIGESQVQGIDYVYTLQGWIKGVNSNVFIRSMGLLKLLNLKLYK